jgi:hypothetical protein
MGPLTLAAFIILATGTVNMGRKIYDMIVNPTFKFKVPEDGSKVYVTPTKQKAVHKLSRHFAHAADFKRQVMSDMTMKMVTPRNPIIMVRNIMGASLTNKAVFNSRAFQDVANDVYLEGELDTMRHYMALGQQKLGERQKKRLAGVTPTSKP